MSSPRAERFLLPHERTSGSPKKTTVQMKRQQEMSAVLNRGPGSYTLSSMKAKSVLPLNTIAVQQIQPQTIFPGAHIDKSEGCTFNINVSCGDQMKIARLNEK